MWKLDHGSLLPVHKFDCGRGAVLSLVTRGEAIYAGCQDGYVTVGRPILFELESVSDIHRAGKVWDLETKTLVRSILVHEVSLSPTFLRIKTDVPQNCAVLSLSMLRSDLYTCCEDGLLKVCYRHVNCKKLLTDHRRSDGQPLSTALLRGLHTKELSCHPSLRVRRSPRALSWSAEETMTRLRYALAQLMYGCMGIMLELLDMED